MASGKGVLISALGGLFLRQARVIGVREMTSRFRWLSVQGDGLRGIDWTPGDKVQVLLPDLDVRTFTPLSWDRNTGTVEFLLYRNQSGSESTAGERPGTHFIRTVREGDPYRFVGPQRSLAITKETPAVLFGDETSFAVARALHSAASKPLACVFEVGVRSECEKVLAEIGLSASICVERAADESHLTAVNDALESCLAKQKDGKLLMTGRAQAIQALQARRRSAGQVRPHKTKAYWSLGKAGLD